MFKDKPISRATIFRVLKECREGKQPENKKKTGRPPKLSASTTKKLVSSAKNKVGQSTRRLSRKFGVSKDTIHRTLVKNNVIYRKRKRAPKYTAKQLEKIPKCCRRLRKKHFAGGKFKISKNSFCSKTGQSTKRTTGTSNRKFLELTET